MVIYLLVLAAVVWFVLEHTPPGRYLFAVWGTLVAYFALAFGVKGLRLTFGPGTFWIQPLFQGAALLIAVALASRQIGRTRRSRRAQADAAARTPNQPSPIASPTS